MSPRMVLSTGLCLLVSAVVLIAAQDEAPSVKVVSPLIEKALKDQLYTSCVAHGDPKPTDLQWLDNLDIPISSTSTSSRCGENSSDDSADCNRPRVYQEWDEAANALFLFITSMKRGDAGTFRCTGKVGDEQVEASFNLNLYLDLTVKDAPEEQMAVINTTALVKCVMVGEPSPDIRWRKDAVNLKSDDHYEIVPKGLKIKHVTEEDAGTYLCRGMVEERAQMENINIALEVTIPPTVIRIPEPKVNGVEALDVVFHCEATGKPMPTYKWYKGTQELTDTLKYNFDKGTLKIMGLVKEDEGEYTCHATNPAADLVVGSTDLVVMITPNLIEMDSDVTIIERSEGRLMCVVSGDPLPDITWEKAEGEKWGDGFTDLAAGIKVTYEEGPTKYSRALILTLNPAQIEHAGTYTCAASNLAGSLHSPANVSISYEAIFKDMPDMVYSWVNNSVNISCDVDANPPATLEWLKGGQPVLNNPLDVTVTGEGHHSEITVKTTNSEDFAAYECRAMNPVGTKSRMVAINEAFAPPVEPTVFWPIVTPTTVSFEITPPTDTGGLPPSGYEVKYHKIEDAYLNEKKTHQFPAAEGVGPYILDGLEPSTAYEMSMSVVNLVGAGVPYEGIKLETHVVREPDSPRFAEKKQDSEHANKYTLTWSPPISNGGKDIEYYEIFYHAIKYADNKTDQYVKEGGEGRSTVDPPQTSFDLRGLKADTEYYVKIFAKNEIGKSQPAEHFFRTQPGQDIDPYVTPKEVKSGGLSTGAIVGIIIAILLIVLIIVDVYCYMTNQCGVLWGICVNLCGKEPTSAKVKEVQMEEGRTGEADAKPKPTVTVEEPQDDNVKEEAPEEIKMEEKEPEDKDRATEETPMIQQESDGDGIETPTKESRDEEDHSKPRETQA